MTNYKVGGKIVKRKNAYMPCALNARLEELDPSEQARLFKAAYWADNITNAEWPVVLGEDGATKSNRSRLKRKGAGWMMALARIAVLNPDLFKAMVEQAQAMYSEQVGHDYPWVNVAALMIDVLGDDEDRDAVEGVTDLVDN